eukprot:349046_1
MSTTNNAMAITELIQEWTNKQSTNEDDNKQPTDIVKKFYSHNKESNQTLLRHIEAICHYEDQKISDALQKSLLLQQNALADLRKKCATTLDSRQMFKQLENLNIVHDINILISSDQVIYKKIIEYTASCIERLDKTSFLIWRDEDIVVENLVSELKEQIQSLCSRKGVSALTPIVLQLAPHYISKNVRKMFIIGRIAFLNVLSVMMAKWASLISSNTYPGAAAQDFKKYYDENGTKCMAKETRWMANALYIRSEDSKTALKKFYKAWQKHIIVELQEQYTEYDKTYKEINGLNGSNNNQVLDEQHVQ